MVCKLKSLNATSLLKNYKLNVVLLTISLKSDGSTAMTIEESSS